jgi:ABC-type antimicrobial peptide transport system ATPase subunit
MAISGEQGSAKTVLSKMLRALVGPRDRDGRLLRTASALIELLAPKKSARRAHARS